MLMADDDRLYSPFHFCVKAETAVELLLRGGLVECASAIIVFLSAGHVAAAWLNQYIRWSSKRAQPSKARRSQYFALIQRLWENHKRHCAALHAGWDENSVLSWKIDGTNTHMKTNTWSWVWATGLCLTALLSSGAVAPAAEKEIKVKAGEFVI